MNRRSSVTVAIIAILGSFPHALSAQNPVEWVRSEARDVPGAEGALASSRPEVTLGVTEEGANLSAIFGIEFGTSLRHSLEVKLTGKLESGQQELELANRSDLPGGIEGTLRYTSVLGKDPVVTDLCREVNELLGAQVPPSDVSEGWERLRSELQAIDDCGVGLDGEGEKEKCKSGKDRFSAYLRFWERLFDVWDIRKADLTGRDRLTDQESFELVTLKSFDLPSGEEVEDRVVRGLCTKWNKDRFADLLLVEVPGPRCGSVEDRLGALSDCCTTENLIDRRSDEAIQTAIRSARSMHTDKVALAKANYQREAKAAEAIVDPTLRQEALDKAGKKRDETQQAARTELANATDDLAQDALRKKAENAVYEELTTAMALEIARWNGAGAPFIVPRPGEVGTVVCGKDDIEAALAAAPDSLAWTMRRTLERLVPAQWFTTASLNHSSQDFKYAKADRSANPTTGLVDTTRDNEHNYNGRIGLSYLRSGVLWTAGIGRKRVWEGAPSAQFCLGADDADALLCSSTGLGPPSRKDTSVYDIQWARQFSPRLAVKTQVFFEDEKDVLNPQLILFFLPQQERLRGGLGLSYTEGADDATEGFNARLFVGMPFEVGGFFN